MKQNPYANAMEQLEKASRILLAESKSSTEVRNQLEVLHHPQRIVNVMIPVTMDNGSLRMFQGYRVQYNNAKGPYKGGIRFHHNVDLDEVKALSFWMAMKCSIADLPLGGGKGGVVVDPKELSPSELERLSRGYAWAIADVIGPDKDVPAPDVNTNGTIMGWMLDEYISVIRDTRNVISKKEIEQLRGTFTGKKIEDGGSEGREEATGLGGLFVLQTVLEKMKLKGTKTKPLTAAVQGFGNVGYNVAKFLTEIGVKVVAVSDSRGGIHVPDGVNTELTLDCKKRNGYLAGCYCTGSVCDIKKGKPITNEELLELDVDILVPSALENVLTKENAPKVKAKVVLEMANGPTTPEADTIMFSNSVIVVPDILANSGGVTVSCFEWQQNLAGEKWTKADVNKKLKAKMEKETGVVWDRAKKLKTDMRTAAFVVAVERILKAGK